MDVYNPDLIRISVEKISIYSFLQKFQANSSLSPFNKLAWNTKKQSRLIESVLMRIPLPTFYIDATNPSWLIVDGCQRLMTFYKFINQELVLEGLNYFCNLNGKKYEELSITHQCLFDSTNLTIFIVDTGTPENVKQDIFDRFLGS